MKDRKPQIKILETSIEKTKKGLAAQKLVIARLEDKLESQRAELFYQKMLAKFDEIDGLRQNISDIIASTDNK